MKIFLYIILGGFVLLLGTQLYLMFWRAVLKEDQDRFLIGSVSAFCGVLLVTIYLLLWRIREKSAAAQADQKAS